MSEIRSAVLSKSATVAFPSSLSWSHYLVLIRVADASARAFYEIEAARENGSARDLERPVASMLFERLAKSRDKAKVLALAREGQQVWQPADVLKEPLVLEYLDMPECPAWRERDLEQAIIDRLEAFLLELGRGFCFVARQKRITIDGDHFYVDLFSITDCFAASSCSIQSSASSPTRTSGRSRCTRTTSTATSAYPTRHQPSESSCARTRMTRW